MRRIIIALLALVTWAPAAQSQAAASRPAQGDPAEEVRRMQTQYADAIEKGDAAALGRIWSDDYTFTNGAGLLVTKAQRLANLKSGATAVQSATERDITVRVYGGDAAVLTSRVTLKAQYSGKEGSGDYRNTAFWVKTPAGWRMAANQITPIVR
jgi:ketosteroid isomerase-like protein